MTPQIKVRQEKGKIVTLALDEEITQVAFKFGSDAHARFFEDKRREWFLGGTDSGHPRRFGDAVLDGYANRPRGPSQSRGSYSCCPFFRTVVSG